MQYVLCFVCGVLVYRIEIKVVEFVLVHVGEPLLVGAALRVRAAVAIASDHANATVVLIGSPTDDTTVAVSTADDATATTSTTTTTATIGTAYEANRAERSGADNATSIAIGTPETWTKLTKRRLRRYWIRPGRMYKVLLRLLLLLLILFLIEFIVFMVIVIGFLKHRVQFATAGTGATRPRTTGARVRKGVGILLGHCIVAVQI